jgi:flagellar FliJ protein
MTQALHTLLEHAERQRDTALAALQRAEDAWRRQQQQAVQLTAYRDEYRGRSPATGGRSASIEMLRCHTTFMQRLEQAVVQQQGQCQAAESRALALRRELLAHELRVASVRKLLERRGEQAQQVANRQEQRRNDEAGQRQRRPGMAASQWGGLADALPHTH